MIRCRRYRQARRLLLPLLSTTNHRQRAFVHFQLARIAYRQKRSQKACKLFLQGYSDLFPPTWLPSKKSP